MSLEKIEKYLSRKNIAKDKSDVLDKIKKAILDNTKVEVNIGLKPPNTMILICGSASASSELNSQKDQLLEIINSIIIEKNISYLLIRQN